MCPNDQDPSLLDGFPLYWVNKGNKDSRDNFRRARSPDNMGELDKNLCLFCKSVASANITFPTASIISFKFLEGQLEMHIGQPLPQHQDSHFVLKMTYRFYHSVFGILFVLYWS